MRARNRDIGTRCSGRLPVGAGVAVAEGAVGEDAELPKAGAAGDGEGEGAPEGGFLFHMCRHILFGYSAVASATFDRADFSDIKICLRRQISGGGHHRRELPQRPRWPREGPDLSALSEPTAAAAVQLESPWFRLERPRCLWWR